MKYAAFAAVALIALAIGLTVAIKQQAEPQFFSQYPEPRQILPFTLQDQNGQPFTEKALQGKWTLTFVGYTFCPDICPTTLAQLNEIYPELQALPSAQPVQVLFISVDPKRDSISRLHEYVQFFNPEFIAATASHDVLFPLVRSMGMMYGLTESSDKPDYLVDHSASVVLINPQGQVVGRFKPESVPGKAPVAPGAQILADMAILTAG